MRFLICLAFLFAAASMLLDNHTTHYALTVYAGQGTYEANPIARGVFHLLGLTPGLVITAVLAIGLYTFVACTHRMTASAKILILVLLGTLRFSAGLNNMAVISAMALIAPDSNASESGELVPYNGIPDSHAVSNEPVSAFDYPIMPCAAPVVQEYPEEGISFQWEPGVCRILRKHVKNGDMDWDGLTKDLKRASRLRRPASWVY